MTVEATTPVEGVVETSTMTDDQRADEVTRLLGAQYEPPTGGQEAQQPSESEPEGEEDDNEPTPNDVEEEGAEKPPEAATDTDEDNDGEFALSSLNDIATALELEDPSDLLGLTTTVKIDGEEKEVSLADITKSYQLEGHLNRKSIELSETQKHYREAIEQTNAYAQQQAQQLDQLAQQLAAQIDYDSQRLSALRETDPEQYLVQKDQLADRQEVFQKAIQQRELINQQQQAAQQVEYDQFLQDQANKVIDLIPDWKDAAKADAEKSKLSSYLMGQEFTTDEVSNLADARLVSMARKAMLFDELQQAKPAITKKVTKAPKVVKSGKATDPKQQKANARHQLLAKAKRGTDADLEAAAAQLFQASYS